jgi:hypothetical protein
MHHHIIIIIIIISIIIIYRQHHKPVCSPLWPRAASMGGKLTNATADGGAVMRQ